MSLFQYFFKNIIQYVLDFEFMNNIFPKKHLDNYFKF